MLLVTAVESAFLSLLSIISTIIFLFILIMLRRGWNYDDINDFIEKIIRGEQKKNKKNKKKKN